MYFLKSLWAYFSQDLITNAPSFLDNDEYGNDHGSYHQQAQYKRFRLPPVVELAKNVCADINTIGETPKRYVEDAEYIPKPILQNFESEQFFREAVLDTFYAITVEQPHKIAHLAGLIQSINTGSAKIGGLIVEFFHQRLQDLVKESVSQLNTEEKIKVEGFETGIWNKIKLVLRLLSCLSFIIGHDDLIKIYKQFLNLAIELQNSKETRSPLGEAIFYNTLISVPYLLIFNDDAEKSELKSKISSELITLAETFQLRSDEDFTITMPYLENTKAPYDSKNIAKLILPALKSELATEFSYFTDLFESLQGLLVVNSEKHYIPQISIPTVEELAPSVGLDNGLGSVDGMWRSSRFTFQVYLPQETFGTTPAPESYFGLLLRDINIDIIEALEFNRKEVARQLITLDLFFKEGVFTFTGRSIDSLKKYIQEKPADEVALSTWKIEDVAFDSVLSLIFKLPTASQPFIYFFTVIAEACSVSSTAIAPVIGRAIRFFYNNIHLLDFELRMRFLDWLSIQLNNFNFSWKWMEWESDALSQTRNIYHPRMFVIRNLIAKNLRLSNQERIGSSLPETFHSFLIVELFTTEQMTSFYSQLLDEKFEVETNFEGVSRLIFNRNGNPFKELTEKLIDVIHKDRPEEDYFAVIKEIEEKANEFSQPKKLLIFVLFQTVLFMGSRSISHANKFINNTNVYLKTVVCGPSDAPFDQDTVIANEKCVIDATLRFWNSEPKTAYIVLDFFESFGITRSLSKIQEAFNGQYGVNLALTNIFTIEAVFKSLDDSISVNVKEGKSGSEELDEVLKRIVSDIEIVSEKLNDSEVSEQPDIYEYQMENINDQWKYQTLMAFLRTILRKYFEDINKEELTQLISSKIKNEATATKIKSWVGQLYKL